MEKTMEEIFRMDTHKGLDKKIYKTCLSKASVSLVNFDIHGDERGSLIALENCLSVPFDIKRVYYIYGTHSNIHRGFHAHRKLRQILIAVSGEVKVKCEFLGKKNIYHLNDPSQGLLIEGLVWREMFDFSPNCVLLVLADDFYNINDYIYDYDYFKKVLCI